MRRKRDLAPNLRTARPRSRFERAFGEARPTITLVPVRNSEQTREVTDACKDAGVDGVCLINDRIGHQKLFRIARDLGARYPNLFVCVHSRDLRPQDAIHRLPVNIGGLWIDDSIVDRSASISWRAIREARRESKWDGLIIDYLALDRSVDSLLAAAELARNECDMFALDCRRPTGSTLIEVIEAVRARLRSHPLAILVDSAYEDHRELLALADCLIVDPGPRRRTRTSAASRVAS